MAKNPKTNRTQLKDLVVAEQELTKRETHRVRGGIAVSDEGVPPDNCYCGKPYKHSGPHAAKK
jgi:hypothetical protein